MATRTRAKDSSSSTVGKEKIIRGTSPSSNNNLPPQIKRATTNKLSPTPPAAKDAAAAASRKHHQVPNYLRPTLSSSPADSSSSPSRFVKKNGNMSTVTQDAKEKAALLMRRRSFDKPPSAIRKGLLSPGPRDRLMAAGGRDQRMPPLRSSSFTPKTISSSSKPILDKASKTPPAGKLALSSSLSANKSMKKTTGKGLFKKELPLPDATTSSASNKTSTSSCCIAAHADDIVQTPAVIDETKQEDKEKVVREIEDVIIVKSDVEVPISDNNIHENVEVVDAEMLMVKHDEDDQELEHHKVCEISSVTKENQEVEEDAHQRKANDRQKGEENNTIEESNPEEITTTTTTTTVAADDHEHNVEAHENQGSEEDAIDNVPADHTVKGKGACAEDSGDENKTEGLPSLEDHPDKEQVDKRSLKEEEVTEEEQATEVVVVEQEAKSEAATVAPTKQQGGQGKKESPAYNDVIEETASKLLEKRKNKVKALVGAFETVISLQEPEA